MSFVLAFDFGLNSIGTAVGNTITRTVTPLRALKAKQGQPNEQELARLIKEWQPQSLVVGLPLNMDGTPMDITEKAQAFGSKLQQRFALKTEFVDERLTTKEAKAMIFEQGGFRALAKDKGAIDNLSAALILEEYFAR